MPTAFIVIQMELKIIASMNLRVGPNRIGPSGMFQSTIHGFKVLAKEDQIPDKADRATFTIAPWMVFMAAAMSMLVIPFAPGAIAADFNIGIVYFFAIIGLSVVGLLVAGWASYNKYSLLGGLRSAAQMVSYEIPLTLSVVGAVVLAGTLNFSQLIEWQRTHGWLFLWQFVGWGSSTSRRWRRSTGRRSTWSRRTARSWPARSPSIRACASASSSSPSTLRCSS